MTLRKVHFEFWQSQQCTPGWARPFAVKASKPSIHACINQHDPKWRQSQSFALQNTLSLLRGIIRRGQDLRSYLMRLITDPGTVIDPDKRSATAARILRKLPPLKVLV